MLHFGFIFKNKQTKTVQALGFSNALFPYMNHVIRKSSDKIESKRCSTPNLKKNKPQKDPHQKTQNISECLKFLIFFNSN